MQFREEKQWKTLLSWGHFLSEGPFLRIFSCFKLNRLSRDQKKWGGIIPIAPPTDSLQRKTHWALISKLQVNNRFFFSVAPSKKKDEENQYSINTEAPPMHSLSHSPTRHLISNAIISIISRHDDAHSIHRINSKASSVSSSLTSGVSFPETGNPIISPLVTTSGAAFDPFLRHPFKSPALDHVQMLLFCFVCRLRLSKTLPHDAIKFEWIHYLN